MAPVEHLTTVIHLASGIHLVRVIHMTPGISFVTVIQLAPGYVLTVIHLGPGIHLVKVIHLACLPSSYQAQSQQYFGPNGPTASIFYGI